MEFRLAIGLYRHRLGPDPPGRHARNWPFVLDSAGSRHCRLGFGLDGRAFAIGLAYAALLLCLALPSRETAFSRFCIHASMSVYLVSPLMTSLLERSTPLTHASLTLALATMAAAFVFALLQYNLITRKRLSTP